MEKTMKESLDRLREKFFKEFLNKFQNESLSVGNPEGIYAVIPEGISVNPWDNCKGNIEEIFEGIADIIPIWIPKESGKESIKKFMERMPEATPEKKIR